MLIQPTALHHRISVLFREDAVVYNELEGPSQKNPGGGLATKRMQVAKALPHANFVVEANQLGAISLIDALYFSGGGTSEEFDRRVTDYRRHNGFKILWTSDFEIFRWTQEQREQILDATDVIAANSIYMYQLLIGYFDGAKVALLTDVIDTNIPDGAEIREPRIYSCSQILIEKGIDEIIALYKGLQAGEEIEQTLKRTFIGSSSTWGLSIRDTDSFNLEIQLDELCELYWSLPYEQVLNFARTAWIYVSFTRYETFGYALTEAMLGGCHVFARPHLAYNDRIQAGVITPVENATDMLDKLKIFLQDNEPKRNDAAIQYVQDNYGLDVFRRQFRNIVGDLYAI